ncbi:MAG: hypothetical protein JST85_10655 [Acidobacteria bacterium]|nr:hypothetical protein [Acidobacteriota bacterium]
MFAINETEFGWAEIIAAAQSWCESQPFVAEIQASLSCLRCAAETGQGLSAQAVKEELTAFRYAHNLISADETKLWLCRWQMPFDELTNYLRGKLLRQKWTDRLNEIIAAHPVSNEEVTAVFRHHAICADKLGDWALKLAGHAAIAAKSGSFDVSGQSQRLLAPRDLVAYIETEFERERRQIITPKLIETKIADHRLDWIRFDCRCLWFADERIAREAVWCVTEDGLSLDEVAASAHAEIRQWNFYLDEIEAGMRPHFLAARPGDLLGPLKLRKAFPLFSLTEKKMPASDDPQIRQRAEQAILRGWMDQAINERVKWMV